MLTRHHLRSDGGSRTWATIATLLATARLNDVDPQAWLTLTLERIANGWSNKGLDALLPGTTAKTERDHLDAYALSRAFRPPAAPHLVPDVSVGVQVERLRRGGPRQDICPFDHKMKRILCDRRRTDQTRQVLH